MFIPSDHTEAILAANQPAPSPTEYSPAVAQNRALIRLQNLIGPDNASVSYESHTGAYSGYTDSFCLWSNRNGDGLKLLVESHVSWDDAFAELFRRQAVGR